MSDRRSFLRTAGLGTLAVGAGLVLPTATAQAATLLGGRSAAGPAAPSAPGAPSSLAVDRGHWDEVPLYGHLGKPTAFTDAEVTFLVNNYSIVLEKFMGKAQKNNAEAASAAACAQIKKKSPKTQVFYYWNSAVDWVDLYASTKSLPSAYTLTQTNGKPFVPRADTLGFDTSNPDLRSWWVDQAANQVTKVGYDGVFIDGIKRYAERTDILVPLIGAKKQKDVTAGLGTMMSALRAKLGTGKTIIYNGIDYSPAYWADGGKLYLDQTDGVMLEKFDGPTAQLAGNMDLCQQVAQAGKMIAFCGSGPLQASGVDFPLACFLCVAGAKSYFRYARLGDWMSDSGVLQSFPQFQKQLGAPAGPATKNGLTYTRTFQHAKVSADVQAGKGIIVWS